MALLSSCRLKLMILYFVLTLAVGCSQSHPLHPSYEELTQRGFYVYVLPEEAVKQRGWSQTVTIWSWDRHCSGVASSETFNPIRVNYGGPQDLSGLTMLIGPWSMYWDHRKPTTEAQLDTSWAEHSIAVYYVVDDDYIHLKFKDRFGIPVQIGSRLPITEVTQLINQLEYIGPPPESVIDPWDVSKCKGQ